MFSFFGQNFTCVQNVIDSNPWNQHPKNKFLLSLSCWQVVNHMCTMQEIVENVIWHTCIYYKFSFSQHHDSFRHVNHDKNVFKVRFEPSPSQPQLTKIQDLLPPIHPFIHKQEFLLQNIWTLNIHVFWNSWIITILHNLLVS